MVATCDICKRQFPYRVDQDIRHMGRRFNADETICPECILSIGVFYEKNKLAIDMLANEEAAL